MLDLAETRAKIERRIGGTAVASILRFVRRCEPRLWGEQQPPPYLEANVLLCLYKDLFGRGYESLLDEFQFGFPLSKRSIMHNVPVIRQILEDWGMEHTPLGTATQWNASCRYVARPRPFEVSCRKKLHRVPCLWW